MLALILFNFSFGKGTLRDIEDSCRFDLRCIYIMQDERPSHMTLGNFINDYILPNAGKFFSLITKAIFDECNLKMDKMYLDGSKFEANANKYKFVWKPTKFHLKLCDKVRDLLFEYNFTDKTEERSNPFRKSDVRIACTFLNSGVILFIIESGGIFSPNGCV